MLDLSFGGCTQQRWYSEDYYEIWYWVDLPKGFELDIHMDDWVFCILGEVREP